MTENSHHLKQDEKPMTLSHAVINCTSIDKVCDIKFLMDKILSLCGGSIEEGAL
eukprot:CAMPEP_0202719114 /NCGR_PEP_ID=MMETSP1385-20130828/128147_1 /ASSEMBLY_ACC=CAM_ASM_000861 /TAXON_ID=933848 /ORGANISM="Elphidium margaritaceum" /LENGTH=53 /DNA_ID=CAMNT_0049382135 /DNA_START=129 /DNA_END=287 /DNA_ORIENTATION=+